MDKRLEKRHKRQVARAREHVKVSEPDVRTPEQIKAAREASQSFGDHRHGPLPPYVTRGGQPESAPAEETPEEEAPPSQ
jgi:hypothetical protein